MRRFFNRLAVCYVVVPAGEERAASSLCVGDDRYQIICEESVVPEFRSLRGADNSRGWFRQQLIKLGIADIITSDFYLSLDADCICVRSVDHAVLVQNGKGFVKYIANASHP